MSARPLLRDWCYGAGALPGRNVWSVARAWLGAVLRPLRRRPLLPGGEHERDAAGVRRRHVQRGDGWHERRRVPAVRQGQLLRRGVGRADALPRGPLRGLQWIR